MGLARDAAPYQLVSIVTANRDGTHHTLVNAAAPLSTQHLGMILREVRVIQCQEQAVPWTDIRRILQATPNLDRLMLQVADHRFDTALMQELGGFYPKLTWLWLENVDIPDTPPCLHAFRATSHAQVETLYFGVVAETWISSGFGGPELVGIQPPRECQSSDQISPADGGNTSVSRCNLACFSGIDRIGLHCYLAEHPLPDPHAFAASVVDTFKTASDVTIAGLSRTGKIPSSVVADWTSDVKKMMNSLRAAVSVGEPRVGWRKVEG